MGVAFLNVVLPSTHFLDRESFDLFAEERGLVSSPACPVSSDHQIPDLEKKALV